MSDTSSTLPRTMTELDEIARALGRSKAVADKIAIEAAYAPARETTRGLAELGDDCAAMPDGSGGYLLLAAEGMLEDFVADDPWFAGYSAVMVNVSDVCAMGGRPTAIVNVVSSPDSEQLTPVWEGMNAASEDYAVPIVGGHTTLTGAAGAVGLSAAILGRARRLLTSFDATPGDELLMAVDLNGGYRGDKPFWNASTSATPDRLQALIELLPELAETGLCKAAKDISNGGIVGTLIMLLQCSRVGANLELDALPRPEGVELSRWLLSFPSFGYLLSVPRENRERVKAVFSKQQIACEPIGTITSERNLTLRLDGAAHVMWQEG